MTIENETGSEELRNEEELGLEEKPESVEDSILRSIEELEGNAPEADEGIQGDEGEKPEAAKVSASEAARVLAAQKKPKKQVIEAKDLQPEKPVKKEEQAQQTGKLEAPVGWDVKDKEEFEKLPEPAKRQSLAFWGRMNKVFTQGTQELGRLKSKYGGLDEVESSYKPVLDRYGVDFIRGTKELWGTQASLLTDRDKTLLEIIEKNGTTLEQLYNVREARLRGGQPPAYQPQQQQQPQVPYLTPEDVDRRVEQRLQAQSHQQVLQYEAQELESVRNERDSSGRYLYPELWDSNNMAENYWNSETISGVKPLYERLRKTQPDLSPGEALKRAIQVQRIADGNIPSSPSPQAQRLPNANTNDIARARAASVSIRSRGNHAISTTQAANLGESVEQSIERAIAELGGNSRY